MSDTWQAILDAIAAAPVLPGALCRGRPHLFDEADPGEADDVTQARHAQALGLCARCPALARCEDWFDSLPPRKKPGGIVAGRCHSWHTTTKIRKAL